MILKKDDVRDEKLTIQHCFLKGMGEALPFLLIMFPYGLLFGVVATDAGWSATQAMAATILVIAGVSQFTAVALFVENAPLFFIVATSLAVNLRMAIYSAALHPHFGGVALKWRVLASYVMFDQNVSVGLQRFSEKPELSQEMKLAFYLGMAATIVPTWVLSSFIGVIFGAIIPEAFALDFAMPILFIAMIAPALKTLSQMIAAATSVGCALLFLNFPYGTGLLLAAFIAMSVGALSETYFKRGER